MHVDVGVDLGDEDDLVGRERFALGVGAANAVTQRDDALGQTEDGDVIDGEVSDA